MLLRVGLGLSPVRAALRFAFVFVCSLAAGAAAAAAARILLASGSPSLAGGLPPGAAAAGAGILAASLTAAAIHVLKLRRARRAQAAEFARLARRLGEEKTARSELKAGLRAVSAAIEGTAGEIFGDDESEDLSSPFELPPDEDLSPAGRSAYADGAHGPWRERRLLRIARAAALFAGKDLDLRRVALAGPCAEVIEEYRRLAGPEAEILYIEDGGGDWLSAPIDRRLLVLLLREVLDNVLAHAGDWRRITVTTEPVAGAIVLRVRDDGRGIPPEAIAAFTAGAFSRGRTGLGLPLALAIAEAHGGSFRIEGEPGQGTAVTVRFPTHD